MAKKKPIIDPTVFCSASEALKEEKHNSVLPASPALDAKLGGGIPEGSLVIIRGLSATGKTLLAMQLVKNALDQGRYVFYGDIERRLTASKYFAVNGLDVNHPKLKIIRSQEGEPILSGDKFYKIIKDLMSMPKYAGALYVVDSFSKIIPQATLEDEEIRADRRDTTPKLNADFCKKAGNLARTTRSIVFGIQHFITNTSGYGDPLVPDGGVKLEYEADICIECRHKPYDWSGNRINLEDKETLRGQLMRVSIIKNKLLAPYISKKNPIECYFKFGEGSWWGREALDFLKDELGICYIKSSWYNIILPDGTEIKAQGPEKAVALVEKHRDIFEKMITEYYIEKYGINYDFQQPDVEEEEEEC